jgi:hypothetical protein
MRKLAIVTTHPIQYYAPVFQLLARRGNIDIKVFYTWSQSLLKKNDPGFERDVSWDIPLLDGYPYEFVENTAPEPGSHHSKGIINPGLIPAITNWKADAVMVIGWAYNLNTKSPYCSAATLLCWMSNGGSKTCCDFCTSAGFTAM